MFNLLWGHLRVALHLHLRLSPSLDHNHNLVASLHHRHNLVVSQDLVVVVEVVVVAAAEVVAAEEEGDLVEDLEVGLVLRKSNCLLYKYTNLYITNKNILQTRGYFN